MLVLHYVRIAVKTKFEGCSEDLDMCNILFELIRGIQNCWNIFNQSCGSKAKLIHHSIKFFTTKTAGML